MSDHFLRIFFLRIIICFNWFHCDVRDLSNVLSNVVETCLKFQNLSCWLQKSLKTLFSQKINVLRRWLKFVSQSDCINFDRSCESIWSFEEFRNFSFNIICCRKITLYCVKHAYRRFHRECFDKNVFVECFWKFWCSRDENKISNFNLSASQSCSRFDLNWRWNLTSRSMMLFQQ